MRTLVKTVIFGVCCISSVFGATHKAQLGRSLFNEGWKFSRGEFSECESESFDDGAWETVRLPHNAHPEPRLVNDQWQGICYYRNTFDVDAEQVDQKVFIEFEGAMNHSIVWINGKQVSDHHGGYLPVVIDASDVVVEGKNLITVRLDNRDNKVTGPKPLKILDFCMYGGLYRNAWITFKDKVYISHPVLAEKTAGGGIFIKTPVVSAAKSIIDVQTHLVNEEDHSVDVSVEHGLYYHDKLVSELKTDSQSVVVGGDVELKSRLEVKDAHLWSPEEPHLYVLKTSVFNGGELVDQQSYRIGLRELVFKNRDLYINGKKTLLRGVNRHQEYPYIGYALSDVAQFRDAKNIRDGGFNFIRLSHYPHSESFMDACDELGILTLDTMMGWQYYSDEEPFREYCFRSAKELVLRDRNRPSVLAWEVSLNETRMPVEFMERLHQIVHAEYPGERVYTCGWQKDIYDIYVQARQHRIMHPEQPQEDQPYIVSEYGDWEYYSNNAGLNQHQLNKTERFEKSSRQLRSYGEARLLQQVHNHQEAHNDNLDTVAFADAYWAVFDYNRGYHDDIESSGIMDLYRIPKFSYYFYQSQRDLDEGKVLQIGTYWTKDSPLDVKVFSNCDEVELSLNGKLIARQKPDSGKNTENLKHPPFTFQVKSYEAGILKAVGYVDGQAIETHVVQTPLKQKRLMMWIDDSGLEAKSGCNDVVFVRIAAVDKNGTIVPSYDQSIDLSVKGDAVIENVGGVNAEAGIATAVVRIGNNSGKITLKAKAAELKSAKLTLKPGI